VLAIATSYNNGQGIDALYTILTAIAWVLFLLLAVRPLLAMIHKWLVDTGRETSPHFACLIFLLLCTSSWVTTSIGVHSIFGAFVLGACVPKEGKLVDEFLVPKIELLIHNFFVPLYYANSGLRTDLSTLDNSLVGALLLIITCSVLAKALPAFFLGMGFKYGWRFSAQLAVLLTARGMIELIALNIAYSAHAFDVRVFSMFVVMALLTAFSSGPLFWLLYDPKADPPRVKAGTLLHPEKPASAIELPSMIPGPTATTIAFAADANGGKEKAGSREDSLDEENRGEDGNKAAVEVHVVKRLSSQDVSDPPESSIV
jgi:Kef-type K+ transport system membrane component KefB